MADNESNSGGNGLSRRLGPLPVWGWMAIGLLIAVMYYLYRKNASNSSATGSTVAANTPGGVDASLVPQFVNQTYVQTVPPAAPAHNGHKVKSPAPSGGNTGGGAPSQPAPPSAPSTPASPLNEILTGGHTINPDPGHAVIGWNIAQQSPNATQLKVVLNGPGHKNQTRYIPASATTATFSDLEPGHTYVASITPVDSQGQAVGGPNHITFITGQVR